MGLVVILPIILLIHTFYVERKRMAEEKKRQEKERQKDYIEIKNELKNFKEKNKSNDFFDEEDISYLKENDFIEQEKRCQKNLEEDKITIKEKHNLDFKF